MLDASHFARVNALIDQNDIFSLAFQVRSLYYSFFMSQNYKKQKVMLKESQQKRVAPV